MAKAKNEIVWSGDAAEAIREIEKMKVKVAELMGRLREKRKNAKEGNKEQAERERFAIIWRAIGETDPQWAAAAFVAGWNVATAERMLAAAAQGRRQWSRN